MRRPAHENRKVRRQARLWRAIAYDVRLDGFRRVMELLARLRAGEKSGVRL